MAFIIKKTKIIDCPPESLKYFELIAYQWIDNLILTIYPKEWIVNADEYESTAILESLVFPFIFHYYSIVFPLGRK